MAYLYALLAVCLYVCMGSLMSWLLYTDRVNMSKLEKKVIFSLILLGWPILLIVIVRRSFQLWLED